MLAACLRLESGGTPLSLARLEEAVPGREVRSAFLRLVRCGAIQPVRGGVADGAAGRAGQPWRLTARGRELAAERSRRLAVWTDVLEAAREDARDQLTMDVPAPEAVLDASRLKAIREAAAVSRGDVAIGTE